MNITVIKIGGHEISDPVFLTSLAAAVKEMPEPVIIVHGGGREISALQTQLGIEPRYVDGVRVTDEASLSVVEMALCGTVNKRLVRYLLAAGVDALGLCGADRAMIRAHKMPHPTIDMGFTGEIEQVNPAPLLDLLQAGVTPVIAPLCLGDGTLYNVNADHVAGAVAGAVKARRVVFVTNVPGVMQDGVIIKTMSPDAARTLTESGVINGGMIPKVQTALQTLTYGASGAVITNLDGLLTNGGTLFTQQLEAEG